MVELHINYFFVIINKMGNNRSNQNRHNGMHNADPMTQQYLQNLSALTNVVCRPVNPGATGYNSNQPDALIILQNEGYQNCANARDFKPIGETWGQQRKYTL